MSKNIINGLNKIKKIFGQSPRKESCVGVDIGSRSIKIVELEKKEGRLRLKNYAYAQTKKKLIKVGTSGILDNVTGEVLKKVLKESGIDSKRANVAIPSFSSLITVFEIPDMDENEIEQVIQIEAPKYIPVKLSDVVYGWQVIERKKRDQDNSSEKDSLGGGKIKILVVAIMKEISRRYEKVFKQSGLEIDSLEIDSFSLIRSLIGNDKGCYLILDIGHKVTDVVAVSNKSILINRTIDIAGEKITSVLAKGLGVDAKRAEQFKIQQGIKAGTQAGRSFLDTTLEIFAAEAKKTMEALGNEYQGLQVEKIILSGGSARIIGLKEFLQQKLGKEVVIGNPFFNIDYPKKLEGVISSQASVFSIAIGLAMLEFEQESSQ